MIGRLSPFLFCAVFFIFAVFVSVPCRAAGPRVILVETMPVPVIQEYMSAFQKRFAELGYENGKTAAIETIKAEGSKEKAIRLLNEARAEGEPNLVVAFATLASQAAIEVFGDTSVPILFCVVADPVGSGIVRELGKPTGDNISGRAHSISRKTKLDMVLRLTDQVRPKLEPEGRPLKFGVVSSDYPSAAGDIAHLEALAEQRGNIRFIARFLKYRGMPNGFKPMMEIAVQEVRRLGPSVDFWWQQTGPLAEVAEFTSMMLQESDKLIALGNTLESVKLGALLALTPDSRAEGRELAELAVEVIKSGEIGDIPVLPAQGYKVGVNLTTAVKMGITIPSDILKLAGKNVYK